MFNNWNKKKKYHEILFFTNGVIDKIVFNRPYYRNSFSPLTIFEAINALNISLNDNRIKIVIFSGFGNLSFCSGGDQNYKTQEGYTDSSGVSRLNVLDLQRLIRSSPKPTIALIKGSSVGGGNILQLLCDLTIASDNSYFKQTGPIVGSFDGGFGCSYLSRVIGHKRAKDFWFCCRKINSYQALDIGMINYVFPLKDLEQETLKICDSLLNHSMISLKCLKASLNADCDGQYGLQELAGCATLLYYQNNDSKIRKKKFINL